jgi:hypothetical protein
MKTTITVAALVMALAGGLFAAPGTIQLRDGTTHTAVNIENDTVSALLWTSERGRPLGGTRFKPWQIEGLRYVGQKLDDFNSLPRKMAGGKADAMLKDAKYYLDLQEPIQGFNKADWEYHIRNTCRYYIAHAYRIKGEFEKAAAEFETFFTECDKNAVSGGILARFTSPITKAQVNNAGGLHRLYLDGLEAYHECLLRADKAEDAKNKAIKALQDLTQELASKSSEPEYHSWTMRALRSSARYAEDKKDYTGARQAYESLQTVAYNYGGAKENRASMEARLKIGYMFVKEGNARQASANFVQAINAWERSWNDRAEAPTAREGWIKEDQSYLAAGSYVGQGLAEAANAKAAPEWAKALSNFSMALSIFHADDEIRSMALLGAANASAQLAELNKSSATVASTHAKLAEKYLAELQNIFPKSKAAGDESVPKIQALIQTHKKNE